MKKLFWEFIATFRANETIVWARIQAVVGAVWTVLSVTDLSPVLNPKLMTYWLVFSGALTEYLRRRGSTQSTVNVVDGTKSGATVSYLQTPPPGP